MEIFVYDERGRVDNNQNEDGETMIAYKLDVIRIEIKVFITNVWKQVYTRINEMKILVIFICLASVSLASESGELIAISM